MALPRKELEARCAGHCEVCGWPLGDNWAIHHRKLRKHGGTDDIWNLLAVHHHCHNLGTGSIHLNPKFSYEMGYLVKSYDDPKEVAVARPEGWRRLLTEDGTYSEEKWKV